MTARTSDRRNRTAERIISRPPWGGAVPWHRLADLTQGLPDTLQGSAGCRVRVFNIRIEFHRHPTVVSNLPHGAEGRGEINGPRAGDEVLVNARGGDVLQVNVPDVFRQPPQGRGWVLA